MALSSIPLGRTQTSSATRKTSPISTLAFDWVYTSLILLLSAGVYMDGWSHIEYGPDQTIFSEYHLLFYTSLMVIGLWLVGNAYRYLRQGYTGLNAIPRGYLVSFIGVMIFGMGGVLDLTGHALFGFEADMETLLSPTHLLLFIGWGMISIGPAKAAVNRYRLNQNKSNISFQKFLPGLISWTLFINVLAFAGMAYFPTLNNPYMLAEWRTTVEWYGHTMGVMGVMAQSALLVASALWLVHSFKLPRGTFTFFMTLFALLTTITSFIPAFIPMFIVTGIVMDVLYEVLKPSSKRAAQLYTFGFVTPFVFWLLFFISSAQLDIRGGVWYTDYIWTGAVFEAGLVGLLMALVSNYSANSLE